MFFTGSIKGVQPSSSNPVFSYSGGKSQLASRIIGLFRHHFPSETQLLSPFLGGGACELRFMRDRRGSCHAADADPHLVMLWQNLIDNPQAVAKHAKSLMPITPDIWREWYADMMSGDWHSVEHAAKYFILRYSRVVHAWSVWQQRLENFNQPIVHNAAFTRVHRFRVPRLSVVHADFREFLSTHDGICYCDPPYYSDDKSYEKVYEKRGAEDDNIFSNADHEALAELLCARKGWVLSYSPHDWVKSRYRDYVQHEVNVTYASRSAQQKNNRDKEVLIVCPM